MSCLWRQLATFTLGVGLIAFLAGCPSTPGPTLSATPGTLNFTVADASLEFQVDVTVDLAWSASTDQPWISLSSQSGNGDGRVTVTVDRAQLDAAEAHSGTVTVEAGNLTDTVNVVVDTEPSADEVAALLSAAFAMADLDGDERLSFTEAQTALPGMTQMLFDAIDEDEDGYLSEAELQAGGTRSTRDIAADLVANFVAVDTDENEELSWTEAREFSPDLSEAGFATIDTNSDEALSREEILALARYADEFESDDTLETAQAIAVGEAQFRTFHNDEDIDWVALEIKEPVMIKLDASTESRGIYFYLALNNASGTWLYSNAGYEANLIYILEEPGTYYVQVSKTVWDVNGLNEYTLHFSQTPVSALPYDSYEHDDVRTEANEIALGATQRHTFHSPTDRDWVAIQVNGFTTLELTVARPDGRYIVLELYDGAQNLIRYSQEVNPTLTHTFNVPGTYYAVVYSVDFEVDGDNAYTLTVEEVLEDP
jgi:hypothetical protein